MEDGKKNHFDCHWGGRRHRKRILRELDQEPVDEIWALGRSAERLEELKRKYGDHMR